MGQVRDDIMPCVFCHPWIKLAVGQSVWENFLVHCSVSSCSVVWDGDCTSYSTVLFPSVPSLGSFSGTNLWYSGIFLLSCMKILKVREDLSVDFSHLPQILSILPIQSLFDGFSNYFNSQIIIIRKTVTSHIIVWCHWKVASQNLAVYNCLFMRAFLSPH